MKQTIFSISCLMIIYSSFVSYLMAETFIPSCSKEELMLFFPKPIVKSILVNQAHLTENEAEEIAKELAVKDKGLAQLVDEKASRYNPNPFQDLSQRDQAIKIYQETLFEVFAHTLKTHGLRDEQQIRLLLDEIRFVKSRMFIDCIRKQQLSSETR